MKLTAFLIVLFISSCVPSMQTGPDPHSIKFEADKFNTVIKYFIENERQQNFDMETAPSEVPRNIITAMDDIGFLEFRNLGKYKVFFCGYGVVGKGWGFIHGDFTQHDILQPSTINGNDQQLYLSYLEKLEDGWYRFGAN